MSRRFLRPAPALVLALVLATMIDGTHAVKRAYATKPRREDNETFNVFDASARRVALPSELSRAVTRVTRVVVPGDVHVRAPNALDRVFRAYALATNETMVRLEKRRRRPRQPIGDGDSAKTINLLVRKFARTNDARRASWRVVDAIVGEGESAWVVFETCDDDWIDDDESIGIGFDYRLRVDFVNSSAATTGDIAAFIATTDPARTGGKSRRCARRRAYG